MQEKFVIRKDKYTKARGGSAKFLTIFCGCCQEEIFLYQKDGPGRLFRMYLDKIVAPKEEVEKLSKITQKSEMKSLKCPKCGSLLAVPMVYIPENRLALRVVGPVHHLENSKGLFPAKINTDEHNFN